MSHTPITEPTRTGRRHTAGLLDIRNIIGLLLGVYGVVLLLMGIFGSTAPAKTGDVNANLWAGLALAVVAAAFLVWARVRPVFVPERLDRPDDDPPSGH